MNSDLEVLAKHHRFVMDTQDTPTRIKNDQEYGEELMRQYYKRLYKDYALLEFKDYRKGELALRWRTEREVLRGKGVRECANKACKEEGGLAVYELNFRYKERGQLKNTLVKVRTCAQCSMKLNYKWHQDTPSKRVHR